ncbi:hypothetical protein [Litoreibacter janthinus]|uniref:Uncharacterized protein n=1 Tax=Litoreibacter janthinus TaxID=670154 RepID=A0A1I6GA37_9RHOB|nr:hypothetical protein [Litoreibacter janthinus]SFR39038.1 hypothetical protein SAMN04488002_1130 [Litoreibacter janthinus]
MGDHANPHRVLGHLADIVRAAADGAAVDADLVEQVAEIQQGLLEQQEAGLEETADSAGGGGGASGGTVQAMGNLASVLSSTAERGQGRAEELEGVLVKQIEEKEGAGGTPGGQSGSGTGSGTGTGPTSGGDPEGGGGQTGPTRPREPVKPEGDGTKPGEIDPPEGGQPPDDGPPVIKRGKTTVLRCYKFRLQNRTLAPVSDIHFGSDAETEGTQVPKGWSAIPGHGAGFGFVAGNLDSIVPPGRALGPFEFCSKKSFKSKIELSHPDGRPNTPLGDGDVTVRGKRPGKNEEGEIVIPATSRKYIHEIEVQTGAGGIPQINVNVGGGKVELVGETGLGENGQWTIGEDGKSISVFPIGAADHQAGNSITVKVSSEKPVRVFGLAGED